MNKEEILEKTAPCSLVCHTCAGYEQGVLCQSARQLLHYLNGMQEFYKTHHPDQADRFRVFMEELEQMSGGPCSGCRNREHHSCSIQGCFILECTQKHSVDFCGECESFPCDRTRELFDDEVYAQWLEGNQEIQASGIEEFWKKHSVKPHYQQYKKSKK